MSHLLLRTDPVLISNITSNGSRLGQDIAVSVQYSGEESAVTWEVDGEPLPERYRLIDDNRTLIIPSVQRDDDERTFRVRITNPVSEETRDHRLINDPIFSKLLETEDKTMYIRSTILRILLPVTALVCIVMIAVSTVVYVMRRRAQRSPRPGIEHTAVPVVTFTSEELACEPISDFRRHPNAADKNIC